MRRVVVRGLLTIAALAVVAPAGLVQAREPVPFQPRTVNGCEFVDGSPVNGFLVDVVAVTDKEYQDVTTLADGTTITNITGRLVLRFTNHSTGYSIVRNVSGPTTETDHLDGTITFVGRGNNWFGIGPTGQKNTGEPGLAFTSGLATLQIASGAVQTFSLSGTQVNGCKLLAQG